MACTGAAIYPYPSLLQAAWVRG